MNSSAQNQITTTSGVRVERCEVCGGKLPAPSLDLGLQPLCDDLVPIGESRSASKHPTQLSICPTCLTVSHLFPVRKELLFPDTYHYRARLTNDVLLGMKNLVEDLEQNFGPVTGKLVCDVGCNDGSLLSVFRGKGARTAGIEPTGAAADAKAAGHQILKAYFDRKSAADFVALYGQPDIVTFTNVFAHIESLTEAIEALRILVKAGGLIVIENHYLGAVFDKTQFDTFYHEHPRTYSAKSFAFIAEKLGGKVVHTSFPGRYGGNIRVFIGDGTNQPNSASGTQPDETAFPERLAMLQTFVNDWKTSAGPELHAIAREIRVAGKSFPARASILINLLGADHAVQSVVYEKPGSMKIGHYVPGTLTEIRSDEGWMTGSEKPDAMIVWAWHISDEVVKYIRESGYRGKLLCPLPTLREMP